MEAGVPGRQPMTVPSNVPKRSENVTILPNVKMELIVQERLFTIAQIVQVF